MLVVSHYQLQESASRAQPWDKTTYTENAGEYYSFRDNPELIREVLEDFKPHESQEAVRLFYEMLEWLNRKDGSLETNDCLLRPPEENLDDQFLFSRKARGRVEFFMRQLEFNLLDEACLWLYRMLSIHLQVERPDFQAAIFDIAACPTDYLNLPGRHDERTGVRFCIYFNAYGNGDAEAWDNLHTALDGLFEAFKAVERSMSGGYVKFPQSGTA
ncbi:TPA: hypothetical protein ACJX8E_006348 [Pseudomonas aeruginosa]